jgi:hypothetical protein
MFNLMPELHISGTLVQAVYLREFVPEFQQQLSGHHGQECAGFKGGPSELKRRH